VRRRSGGQARPAAFVGGRPGFAECRRRAVRWIAVPPGSGGPQALHAIPLRGSTSCQVSWPGDGTTSPAHAGSDDARRRTPSSATNPQTGAERAAVEERKTNGRTSWPSTGGDPSCFGQIRHQAQRLCHSGCLRCESRGRRDGSRGRLRAGSQLECEFSGFEYECSGERPIEHQGDPREPGRRERPADAHGRGDRT
jgi:hypothetical protein